MPQGTMSRVRVNHIGHSNTVRYQRDDGTSDTYQLNERGELDPTPVRFFFGEDGFDDDDEIRDFYEIDWGRPMDDEIPPLRESFLPDDAPWPGETILPDGSQPTGGEAEAPQRHDVTASVGAFLSDSRHVFNVFDIAVQPLDDMLTIFHAARFCEFWKEIFDCYFHWLSGLLGHAVLRECIEKNYVLERRFSKALKQWMRIHLPRLIPSVRPDILSPWEAANLLFQMMRGLAIEKASHNFTDRMRILTANFFRKTQIWAEVLEEFTDKKVVQELAKSNFFAVREMVVRAMVEDRQP
jgi:hypothetical protein